MNQLTNWRVFLRFLTHISSNWRFDDFSKKTSICQKWRNDELMNWRKFSEIRQFVKWHPPGIPPIGEKSGILDFLEDTLVKRSIRGGQLMNLPQNLGELRGRIGQYFPKVWDKFINYGPTSGNYIKSKLSKIWNFSRKKSWIYDVIPLKG